MAYISGSVIGADIGIVLKETIYVQIPLVINDRPATGELYVIKNKIKKNQADGAASAFVSLDTANLGKFEVYIVKDKKNISCQFRLADESIDEKVKENIENLRTELKKYGYALGGYFFKKQAEHFNLLSREPDSNDGETPAPEPVKYIFDVRM